MNSIVLICPSCAHSGHAKPWLRSLGDRGFKYVQSVQTIPIICNAWIAGLYIPYPDCMYDGESQRMKPASTVRCSQHLDRNGLSRSDSSGARLQNKLLSKGAGFKHNPAKKSVLLYVYVNYGPLTLAAPFNKLLWRYRCVLFHTKTKASMLKQC